MQRGNTLLALLALLALPLHATHFPSVPITVSVHGGEDSFFDFRLSNVPQGTDVTTNVYLAWCSELDNTNDPTFGGGVRSALLMSTSWPDLPARWQGKPWDKINYLLNNKRGRLIDVQSALWFFTDGYTPDPEVYPVAIELIAEADVLGAGFTPGPHQITTAAVVWQDGDADTQGCIIEVPPSTLNCLDRYASGGFFSMEGKRIRFNLGGGTKKGRLWGRFRLIDRAEGFDVRSRALTSYTVLSENVRRATYDVTVNGEPATATVRVWDNGRIGRNDRIQITLSTGYSTGAGEAIGDLAPSKGRVRTFKPTCNLRGR
jgi:hypothetical protein